MFTSLFWCLMLDHDTMHYAVCYAPMLDRSMIIWFQSSECLTGAGVSSQDQTPPGAGVTCGNIFYLNPDREGVEGTSSRADSRECHRGSANQRPVLGAGDQWEASSGWLRVAGLPNNNSLVMFSVCVLFFLSLPISNSRSCGHKTPGIGRIQWLGLRVIKLGLATHTGAIPRQIPRRGRVRTRDLIMTSASSPDTCHDHTRITGSCTGSRHGICM